MKFLQAVQIYSSLSNIIYMQGRSHITPGGTSVTPWKIKNQ
jgi:hypothetical protein